MHRIGITGGIGMGKSTALKILHDRGIPIIDTDQIAREVVASGSNGLAEVIHSFGSSVLKPDGSLNRQKLASIVFEDPKNRKMLESILHPKIRRTWEKQLSDWEDSGEPVGVIVSPLLFEAKAEKAFDQIVCISCPLPMQTARLTARGWSETQIQQRVGAQLPIAEKMQRSSIVIWNAGPLQLLEAQLAAVTARWLS
ncbi:dephospho-CoA kinase [Verrucomicrobia bacterium]|nr:dephospho-CoA kinase [Verrucomicrobiota bacterium]MDB4459295.1 dephospho-CoA kinase [bacterium]